MLDRCDRCGERPWFSGRGGKKRSWRRCLPAVEIGLRFLDRIGIDVIRLRVSALGAWLLEALRTLRHRNGSPAATIYGPRGFEQRGATIAFNFLHPDGRVVVERIDLAGVPDDLPPRLVC